MREMIGQLLRVLWHQLVRKRVELNLLPCARCPLADRLGTAEKLVAFLFCHLRFGPKLLKRCDEIGGIDAVLNDGVAAQSSEERRVGTECGRTCRRRCWPDHTKKKT